MKKPKVVLSRQGTTQIQDGKIRVNINDIEGSDRVRVYLEVIDDYVVNLFYQENPFIGVSFISNKEILIEIGKYLERKEGEEGRGQIAKRGK